MKQVGQKFRPAVNWGKKSLLVIAAILVVGLAAGGWFIYKRHHNTTPKFGPGIYSKNVTALDTQSKLNSQVSQVQGADISKLSPEQLFAHYAMLAGLQQSTNDYKGALDNYQKALSITPNSPAIYLAMAECNAKLGDKTTAKTNYNKAIAMYSELVKTNADYQLALDQAKSELAAL